MLYKLSLTILIVILFTAGCATCPTVTIPTPTEIQVLVPIGNCNWEPVINELNQILSKHLAIDFATVPPEDRVKVLCEIAAQHAELRAVLEQILLTLQQNQLDCQRQLDEYNNTKGKS